MKEKLKLLKGDLKVWNKSVFGKLEELVEEKKDGIMQLNHIDEAFGLEDEEIVRRNQLTVEFIRSAIWRDKLLAQKAKVKWISEGDVNSKFFHNWINRRAKSNGIEGIWMDSVWIDAIPEVKKMVAVHFKKEFGARNFIRPNLPADMYRNQISDCENEVLTSSRWMKLEE